MCHRHGTSGIVIIRFFEQPSWLIYHSLLPRVVLPDLFTMEKVDEKRENFHQAHEGAPAIDSQDASALASDNADASAPENRTS